MSGAIRNVKNNINQFVNKLAEQKVDIRLGLIEYKDITCDGSDATKIFEGLQDDKDIHILYREGMTKYILNENTFVGYSYALSNTQFGPGGFLQYYISNYKNILEPIETILLTNR